MKIDIIIIGAGASGIMAAISAARDKKRVLLLEKLPKIALKLKATGGGRCNLTNTLDTTTFMEHFGKNGRFMQEALKLLDSTKLRAFLSEIGVDSDAPDGFRVFPKGHSSATILEAFKKELKRLNVKILCSCEVLDILPRKDEILVKTNSNTFNATNVIIATGGAGYPKLGATGDGYKFAKKLDIKVTKLHPAMMPLKTKEKWVANCRANTIAKATVKVDIKKYQKYKATGDLIFTKDGIRGPVILDFSREITPLLDKFGEVPIVVNLTKGLSVSDIAKIFKQELVSSTPKTTLELVEKLVPTSVAKELILLSKLDANMGFKKQDGAKRDKLINLLAWTPLNIIGHNGFEMAMITRGGVSLKEINPHTLESKKVKNLYFCGEVIDIDGPCGGYNLQWAFSSGFLAGKVGKRQ